MLYEYKCSGCQHVFTETHSVADRKIPLGDECPNCGKGGTVFISLGSTMTIDPYRLGRIKPNHDHRLVINKIKEGNKGSTINEF